MEDLIVHHDGTVRDANHNIIQYHYGEDGVNATKIETQELALGRMSEEDILKEFGLQEVDWSTVLIDGVVREADEDQVTAFVQQVLEDQRMMVEEVYQRKAMENDMVFAPVNLARMILNIKIRFGLKADQRTDLTPKVVLDGINRILQYTHSYHKIWAALLRYHFSPHKLIVKERFTKAAFEVLMELVVANHMKTWVQPGDQVGIVAAQSIGEPATQMSAVGSTVICITNGRDLKYYGSVREFIDPILGKNSDDVKEIARDSVVLSMDDIKEDYYIVGVSDDEKTSWRRISEISRHPANGGLVEVVTRTGRRTTATLTHSFLKRAAEGIVPVLGSDLKVGMRIPVARVIPEAPNALTEMKQGDTTYQLDYDFGWVCGIYLADGSFNGNTVIITKISPVVEERLKVFCARYGLTFTTRKYEGQFGPCKSNLIYSKPLHDFLQTHFKSGSFDKEIGAMVFHANAQFIAGVLSGFFDGDGNVSAQRQMIRAGSRSKKLMEQVSSLLGYVGMFGSMGSETSVRIPDAVMWTLCIPRKFAQAYKDRVGFHLTEKAEALDQIIAYNNREDVVTQLELLDKIPELGKIIAQTGKLLRFPGQSSKYGRWAKKESIGRRTLERYVGEFEAKFEEMKMEEKDAQQVRENLAVLRSAVEADVFWDEIVELIYHEDPKEYVYDFTVPGNDSFMVDNNILVHNTLNKCIVENRRLLRRVMCPLRRKTV
jgi:intein/homing endonuclease